jgi:ATP-binding protein involved in chromosome partitioning
MKAGFSCPNCGHRSEIFAHGGARREAERFGVDFLGEIPLDIAIRVVTRTAATSIVMSDLKSPHAAAYRDIAQKRFRSCKLAGAAQAPGPAHRHPVE